MENELASQETPYELMFEGRPLFSGTLFNTTGNLVHSKKMAETESCFLIKNVYIPNVRKTNFYFDADRHCVGTTIASKNDSVRVRGAAKHHRVKKNIVINSQDFSNVSTNVTSGSLVNMFWGASQVAFGIVDCYCTRDVLLKVTIKEIFPKNINALDESKQALLKVGAQVEWAYAEIELNCYGSLQKPSKPVKRTAEREKKKRGKAFKDDNVR